MSLILASGSAARRALLQNAGFSFTTVTSAVDERAAERPLLDVGAPPEGIALALAKAKGVEVSGRRPADLVIGADQVLAQNGERLVKPKDMEAARRQLLRLSGRQHRLHSAVACVRGGEVVWEHVETATLTMRRLEPELMGRYLAGVGPAALASVGSYQLEGLGIQLFERIEGDYFAILGLPILPLLHFLRTQGFGL
jgi:septum formation protein